MDTTTNQNSPFLALPPELRNRIYFATLATGDVKIAVVGYHERKQAPPPLLQTCPQIRNEALQIYCASNTFHIQTMDYDTKAAIAWVQTLDPRAAVHIIDLRFDLTSDVFMELPSFLEHHQKGWEALGRALERAGVPLDSVSVRLDAYYESLLINAYPGDKHKADLAVFEAGKAVSMAYTFIDLGMGREARDMLRERRDGKPKD